MTKIVLMFIGVGIGAACAHRPSAPAAAPLPDYEDLMDHAGRGFADGDYRTSADYYWRAVELAPDREDRVRALVNAAWAHLLGSEPEGFKDAVGALCGAGVEPPQRRAAFPGRNGDEVDELFAISDYAGWTEPASCTRLRERREEGRRRAERWRGSH